MHSLKSLLSLAVLTTSLIASNAQARDREAGNGGDGDVLAFISYGWRGYYRNTVDMARLPQAVASTPYAVIKMENRTSGHDIAVEPGSHKIVIKRSWWTSRTPSRKLFESVKAFLIADDQAMSDREITKSLGIENSLDSTSFVAGSEYTEVRGRFNSAISIKVARVVAQPWFCNWIPAGAGMVGSESSFIYSFKRLNVLDIGNTSKNESFFKMIGQEPFGRLYLAKRDSIANGDVDAPIRDELVLAEGGQVLLSELTRAKISETEVVSEALQSRASPGRVVQGYLVCVPDTAPPIKSETKK